MTDKADIPVTFAKLGMDAPIGLFVVAVVQVHAVNHPSPFTRRHTISVTGANIAAKCNFLG